MTEIIWSSKLMDMMFSFVAPTSGWLICSTSGSVTMHSIGLARVSVKTN